MWCPFYQFNLKTMLVQAFATTQKKHSSDYVSYEDMPFANVEIIFTNSFLSWSIVATW